MDRNQVILIIKVKKIKVSIRDLIRSLIKVILSLVFINIDLREDKVWIISWKLISFQVNIRGKVTSLRVKGNIFLLGSQDLQLPLEINLHQEEIDPVEEIFKISK